MAYFARIIGGIPSSPEYVCYKKFKILFADRTQTLGHQCSSYATIKNWVAEFNSQRLNVKEGLKLDLRVELSREVYNTELLLTELRQKNVNKALIG